MRCQVEQEKLKFISTSGHVIFCLLYKHNNDDVFDDLPKISDHFPKISKLIFQNCSEGKTNVSKHFSDNFRRLPKISEDNRRFPRRDRWCFNHTATYLSIYFLRDYVTIEMVTILVAMATPISSHVKDKKAHPRCKSL